MTEIFDPKLTVKKSKKIWQKHGFRLILIFILILLIISGYLIYIFYLSPSYELYGLLPKEYDVSFELKTDRFIFPPLQQKQLLENQTINQLYQEVKKEIDTELSNLPFESQAIFNKFKHLILVVSSAESFGLIGKIPDKKTAKQLNQLSFPDLFAQIIKDQILVVSNNQSLLNEMASQKLFATTLPYFSISVSPWFKINIQKSFFDKQYQSQSLTYLQQILLPLSLTSNNYSLEISSSYNLLELLLTPDELKNQGGQLDLSNLLSYLSKDSDTVFGLVDLGILMENLEKNENLQALFRQLDSYFWLELQISLSNLMKNIKGPFLIGLSSYNWQIVTNIENKELANYYLRQYFGQFKPKAQEISLPDGTKATELINNPASVVFDEYEINSWKISQVAGSSKNVGYAEQEGLLIIGNNLTEIFNNQGFSQNCQKENVSMIFSLNPIESGLKPSDFLKKFANITAILTNSGQIKACIELN